MAYQISTKDHILQVAGLIFSENGYRTTTIRMIAEAAGVNVAAVNYHYGSKEQLYVEVMHTSAVHAFEEFPEEILTDKRKLPEERIRLFIWHTLRCILGSAGEGTTFGKLMSFEASSSPSNLVQDIFNQTIGTRTKLLTELVKQITQIENQREAEAISACIVGQTVYFLLSGALTGNLFAAEKPHSADDMEHLSDIIYRFSLAALNGLKR